LEQIPRFLAAAIVCLELLLSIVVTKFLLQGGDLNIFELPLFQFISFSSVFLCPNLGGGLMSDDLTWVLEVE
jgi:hypothetical protein